MADFLITNHGTISTFMPLTEAANEWLDMHIHPDAAMLGRATVVEHRYVEPIVEGIEESGLTFERA